MNAERLHSLLAVLSTEIRENDTVTKMQALISALQNVINSPNGPNQQALAASIKTFYASTTKANTDALSPAYRQILHEIGGERYFGSPLREKVEEIFATNQITPAVALDELQQLFKRLQLFEKAIDQATSAFQHFDIGDESLKPGECEIGVLIPRKAVGNRLLDFSEELKDIGFLLNTFAEVATGRRDELSIKTISSSDLLVHLNAIAPYAACLAVAIERTVALYKQLLEVRKLRQDLKTQGVPDEQTSGIEKYANQLMETGIEKAAAEIVEDFYKVDDRGRKNELTTSVKISLNMLANRIDKGFNIEVRAEPLEENEEAEDQEEVRSAVARIQSASSGMQFLKLEGQPILKLPEAKEKAKKKE